MYRNIPVHFEALFETIDGAVILAHTVNFHNLVADAQIVAASTEAALLYGYNHHSELEGKFTSELDHPDDYQTIKIMSLVRVLELSPTPDEYDVRIILPNGMTRYIRKRVRQIYHDNAVYWMTKSEEISQDEAKPLPDFRDLLTSDKIHLWFGLVSMAELSKLVHNFTPKRNRRLFGNHLTENEFHPIIHGIHSEVTDEDAVADETERIDTLPNAVSDLVINIELGKTLRLPDKRFIHRCGNCAETWASGIRNPLQCPRSRVDSRGPKCGTKRWRIVTERGQEFARKQEAE